MTKLLELPEELQRDLHRAAAGGEDLHPTLAEKAAALGYSLVSNHAFIDGNKRIGHKAMETFLILNGFEISAPIDEAEQTVLRLATGELAHEGWVR